MAEIAFVKFVRSVEGRAAAFFGSGSRERANDLIGARRLPLTPEDRAAGKPSIEWDTERVTPLTEEYYRLYRKEVDRAIKHGDLVEATEAEWKAWLELEELRELEHVERLEAEQAARAKVEGQTEGNEES